MNHVPVKESFSTNRSCLKSFDRALMNNLLIVPNRIVYYTFIIKAFLSNRVRIRISYINMDICHQNDNHLMRIHEG